jgi:hypothetical protein
VRHVDGEVPGEAGGDAAQDPSVQRAAKKPAVLPVFLVGGVHGCSLLSRVLRAALSIQVGVCFLKRFEQLEHARERPPGVGAFGAYSSLKPSVRSPVDIEKKANRLPRCW